MATPTNSSAKLIDDDVATSSTLNAGFTFTAGRDGVVTLSHFQFESNRISGVTIGGTAATRIVQQTLDAGSVEVWRATGIAGGTAEVVISYSAGVGHYVTCAVDEWAADTFAGVVASSANGATGSGTAPSVSTGVSVPAGTVLYAVFAPYYGSDNINPGGPSGWNVQWSEADSIDHQAGRGAWVEDGTTGTKTATFSQNTGQWLAAIVALELAPVATVGVAGYRWHNDDGDEDGSTAAAAQDANLTAPTAVNKIVRFLLQAAGDPASKTFTLRAQKNGAGGYLPVAVGASPTGTINNQPVAAGADDAQQVGTTMTVTGTTIGASLDATTEYVGIRFGSVNIPKGATITTAYMRVVPSGTGEDEPLVTIAGLAEDNAAAFTTTASDITNRSITTATQSWSSTNLGASGSSYHNTPSLVSIVQEIIDRSGWASGNAIGFRIQGGATSTRDLTIESYENTGNNPPQLYVEYTYSPDIFISPSSNITAGGEDTTQRLSGGTGSFTTGRMWDNENGSDSIDIGEDGNTELAWCIQLRSGLSGGDYFDLKVYDGDTPLDGDPARWTVTASAVELVVGDCAHGHAADAPSLTQANTLAVADAVHQHITDAVTLSQAVTLSVGGAAHAHAADGVNLTQANVLDAEDSVHGQHADAPGLVQDNILAVGDSAHAQAADTVALVQANVLAVADSIHAHAAGAPVLSQSQLLAVGDSVHAIIAEALQLTQAHVLAIESAVHAHVADGIDLSTAGSLSVGSSAHGHHADAAELVQSAILTVGDSAHTLVTASIALSQGMTLAVEEAIHAHVADEVVLTQSLLLAVASAVHLHAADEVDLTQASTIVVSDSVHAHIAQQINLLMPGGLPVPPGRTIVVQAKSRVIVIQPESRTIRVH